MSMFNQTTLVVEALTKRQEDTHSLVKDLQAEYQVMHNQSSLIFKGLANQIVQLQKNMNKMARQMEADKKSEGTSYFYSTMSYIGGLATLKSLACYFSGGACSMLF